MEAVSEELRQKQTKNVMNMKFTQVMEIKTREISRSYFLMLPFLLIMLACNGGVSNNKYQSNAGDTLVKDIPEHMKVESVVTSKHAVEQKLGIVDLTNGYDSLQIRIYCGYAFKRDVQLIVLKNDTHSWTGVIYGFLLPEDKRKDSAMAGETQVKQVTPGSGWNRFVQQLFDLDILSLPDYSAIPGYETGTDGDAVTIEIASKNHYRIYRYPEPLSAQEKISQAKRVEQIFDLLEKELGFNRLRKF
jgi:hypothetical protein